MWRFQLWRRQEDSSNWGRLAQCSKKSSLQYWSCVSNENLYEYIVLLYFSTWWYHLFFVAFLSKLFWYIFFNDYILYTYLLQVSYFSQGFSRIIGYPSCRKRPFQILKSWNICKYIPHALIKKWKVSVWISSSQGFNELAVEFNKLIMFFFFFSSDISFNILLRLSENCFQNVSSVKTM